MGKMKRLTFRRGGGGFFLLLVTTLICYLRGVTGLYDSNDTTPIINDNINQSPGYQPPDLTPRETLQSQSIPLLVQHVGIIPGPRNFIADNENDNMIIVAGGGVGGGGGGDDYGGGGGGGGHRSNLLRVAFQNEQILDAARMQSIIHYLLYHIDDDVLSVRIDGRCAIRSVLHVVQQLGLDNDLPNDVDFRNDNSIETRSILAKYWKKFAKVYNDEIRPKLDEDNDDYEVRYRQLMNDSLMGDFIDQELWSDVSNVFYGASLTYHIQFNIRNIRDGREDSNTPILTNDNSNRYIVHINNHPDHDNVGGHFDLPIHYWETIPNESLTAQPTTNYIPSQQPTQMPTCSPKKKVSRRNAEEEDYSDAASDDDSTSSAKEDESDAASDDDSDSSAKEDDSDAASDDDIDIDTDVDVTSLSKKYVYKQDSTALLPTARSLKNAYNFGPKLLTEIEKIKVKSSTSSKLELIIRKYVPVLEFCNGYQDVMVAHELFREDVHTILRYYECEDLINMGDSISKDTLLLM